MVGVPTGLEAATEKCREIFSRVTMMTHLGVEFVSMTEDSAELALTGDERHRNYLGALHGGAIAAAIDTVAFMPGALLPSGRKLATEGMELHFFKPSALGERVTFGARILRNGRRVVTVECDARVGGAKIAHAIVTLIDLDA